jgi:hypothetical protein
MCGIEPSNLADELPGLRIGIDSVDWYQKEIDRYRELNDSNETGESEQEKNAEYLKRLIGFSTPFLQS